MNQSKSVKKFILISPNAYDNFTKNVIIPSRQNLVEAEIAILDVMKNEKINALERLLLYNNILKQKLSKTFIDHHNDDKYYKPKIQNLKQTSESSTQTNYIPRHRLKYHESENEMSVFSPLNTSSPIEEKEKNKTKKNYEEENKEAEKSNDVQKFYHEDIYENIPMLSKTQQKEADQNDYSFLKQQLYEDVRRASNVSDLRNLNIDYLDDSNKSYVKVSRKDPLATSHYIIPKPEIESSPSKSKKKKEKTRFQPKRIQNSRQLGKSYKSWTSYEEMKHKRTKL